MNTDPATNQDLWNEDLAPTGAAQRTWRWYHFAALWVGIFALVRGGLARRLVMLLFHLAVVVVVPP